MKVRELIEILQEEMDPEAEVLIMSQQNWPFENTLAGVCQRSDLVEEDDGEAEDEDQGRGASGEELPANDVFLVEGTQLRYGSKRAWDVARRW